MPNPWFPTIAEFERYDEQRRREERIDELIGNFLTQLHVAIGLPLSELATPPDPTSVMADLD